MRPRAVGLGLVVVVGLEALASISAAAFAWAHGRGQAAGAWPRGGAVVRLVACSLEYGEDFVDGVGLEVVDLNGGLEAGADGVGLADGVEGVGSC